MRKQTLLKALFAAAGAAALLGTAYGQSSGSAATSSTQQPGQKDPGAPQPGAQGSWQAGAQGSPQGEAQGSSQGGAQGSSQGGAQGSSQGGAQGSSQAGGQQAGPDTAAKSSLSKSDQKYITDMAMGNMAEIEMGKLAQSKSQNDQVKTFAQQMIDDHTRALGEVQQLASSKGVTMPTELDKQHKAAADKLGAMSGEKFDKAYIAQGGMSDHKKMHSLLASAQSKAKDPDIKALAARLQPTVDQHMKAAQQLGGSKSMGSSTPASTSSGR